MRFILLALSCAAILAGCAAPTPVGPRSGFSIVGVSGASPNASGWVATSITEVQAVFGATGPANGESTVATTQIFRIPDDLARLSDRALLSTVTDRRQRNDPDLAPRFEFVSRNNSPTTFKGAACMRSTWVARDLGAPASAGPGPVYMKVLGYTCRHPEQADGVVVFEVSNRSSARSLPAAVRAVADRFFADIRFTKNGL